MIFQTLDIKENCKGIYSEKEFKLEPTSECFKRLTATWKHSPVLPHDRFEYLYLYTKGANLSDFSPDPDQLSDIQLLLQSQKAAAQTAKISLEDMCFFDLLPTHQMKNYFESRHFALQVLHNSKHLKGEDYDILHKAHILTSEIAHQDLMFEGKKGRVQYNIFGSATGRLTTKKGSVPIMTLKKEDRYKITPQNDAFVELDLNAAEVRTLMALSGREQPQEDIHAWVTENVFSGELERSKAKVELFAWLYNPSNSKSQFDKFFSRQIFRDFFAPEDQTLKTPFGRVLAVDERKAQTVSYTHLTLPTKRIV